MPLPVSWNGDGLAAGTLTSSSAGTGDTPFSNLSGGTSITIDSSGTTPPRISMAAATAHIYAGWDSTHLGTISAYRASCYFELETLGSASWAILTGSTGTSIQWRVDVAGTASTPPSVVRLRNGTAQVAASSQALAAGTLYRLEVVADGAAITATVYAGTTSTVAAGPISGTASSASITDVRFGNFTSVTSAPRMFFDGLSVAGSTATITGSVSLAGSSSLSAASGTNLLVGSNYEGGSLPTGFAAYGGSTTSLISPGYAGTQAARAETNTTGAQGLIHMAPLGTGVSVGTKIRCGTYFRGGAGLGFTISGRVYLTNAESYVTEAKGAYSFAATGDWQYVQTADWTLDTHTETTFRPGFQISRSGTAGLTMDVDDAFVAVVPVHAGVAPLAATSTLSATATVATPAPEPAPTIGLSFPPPGTPSFFVAVRDANLNRVGAISPIALAFTPRHNDVGEWSLQVYAESPNADRLRDPGAGILIYRGDDMALLMSGPVGSRKLSQTDEGLLLEVSGPDDNVWIASRLAFQMPSRTVPNQGTPTTGALTHDRRSGAAEAVVKGYVDANAGQAALTDRRVLTVAAVAATPRGATVTGAARMTPLLDLIRGLAETGGIGFRVTQVGTSLVFDVFTPTDRTATARFSPILGNLESFEFTETAPSASYVVSGGQGQGIARAFNFTSDSQALTAWPRWRVERFIDQRQAEADPEIAQARLEELASGGPQTSLAITTRDTAQVQFGRDYFVGDRVTVEPIVGAVVKEVLREVTVTWDADRTTVVSRVGTVETTGTSKVIRALRRLTSKSAAVNTVE